MPARRLPSLTALRAFEATARRGSAKQAAEELSVTPTAISHQVRQLEATLGVSLFIRGARQLRLTPQGHALQATLGDAFDTIAEAVARVRAAPPRQAVTLSTTPAIAARWLLPRVGLLSQAHPDLDLHIHASHRPVPLDGVQADLAIRYGRGDWPGLVVETLFDNRFVPACSPALGLRRRRDLPRHTLLHFEPLGGFSAPVSWTVWQQQAQVPGLDTRAGPVFSDETHAVAAALGQQGIALMSHALIADELRAGTLVRPFGPDLPGLPFHLVYPPARAADAAPMAVRDWVLSLRDTPPPG